MCWDSWGHKESDMTEQLNRTDKLIYNIMLVSGVQQGDSVIHTHVFFPQILFPFRLLHNIEQNSLYYTVGPCFLTHFKYSSVHISILFLRFILVVASKYLIPFYC